MKNKLLEKLKDNKGSSELVGAIIVFLVLIAFVVVGIAGFKLMNEYTVLNQFADQMTITVSDAGKCTGAAIDRRYVQLTGNTGISPDFTYSANFVDAAKKTVQYGNTIEVTASHTTAFSAFGIRIPVTLKVNKSGKSEQYWK